MEEQEQPTYNFNCHVPTIANTYMNRFVVTLVDLINMDLRNRIMETGYSTKEEFHNLVKMIYLDEGKMSYPHSICFTDITKYLVKSYFVMVVKKPGNDPENIDVCVHETDLADSREDTKVEDMLDLHATLRKDYQLAVMALACAEAIVKAYHNCWLTSDMVFIGRTDSSDTVELNTMTIGKLIKKVDERLRNDDEVTGVTYEDVSAGHVDIHLRRGGEGRYELLVNNQVIVEGGDAEEIAEAYVAKVHPDDGYSDHALRMIHAFIFLAIEELESMTAN